MALVENMTLLKTKYTPSLDYLNTFIAEFVRKTNYGFQIMEIIEILKRNNFQGVYIVEENDFRDMLTDEFGDVNYECLGFYDRKMKVIVISKDSFSVNKEVGVHELAHAIMDGRVEKRVSLDDRHVHTIGGEIEEAIASLVEVYDSFDSIDDIGKINFPCCYKIPVYVLLQLNKLYSLDENKKYKDLVMLGLKRPEDLIRTIADMKCKILSVLQTKIDVEMDEIDKLAYRSCLDEINLIDFAVDKDTKNDNEFIRMLYSKVRRFNSVLLFLRVNGDVIPLEDRDNYRYLVDFIFLRESLFSVEYKLLNVIFGDGFCYNDIFKILDRLNREALLETTSFVDKKLELKKGKA